MTTRNGIRAVIGEKIGVWRTIRRVWKYRTDRRKARVEKPVKEERRQTPTSTDNVTKITTSSPIKLEDESD